MSTNEYFLNILKKDFVKHINETLKADNKKLLKELSEIYINKAEYLKKSMDATQDFNKKQLERVLQALQCEIHNYMRCENLLDIFIIWNVTNYMTKFKSFPSHTKIMEIPGNDFKKRFNKIAKKNTAKRKKLIKLMDSQNFKDDEKLFKFYLDSKYGFAGLLENNKGVGQLCKDMYDVYSIISFLYICNKIQKFNIRKVEKIFNSKIDPLEFTKTDLFKIPLMDMFYKKPVDKKSKAILPKNKKNENVIELRSKKNIKILSDDLFTFAKMKGGLSKEYQKLIETGFALLQKKETEKKKRHITFDEIAEFTGKIIAGGSQYIELAKKFIDLTKIFIADDEGYFKFFVPVGIKRSKHFINFDSSQPDFAIKILKQTFFEMPVNTYEKLSKKKFFYENQEYFKEDSFINIIVRKINTKVTRGRNFKFNTIKDTIKISLGNLTDDAGIIFNYNKQPKRDFNGLLGYFQKAIEKGYLDEFYVTVYDSKTKTHIQHEILSKGKDKFSIPTIKRIKENREKIYFNCKLSDLQREKLKGNEYYRVPNLPSYS